MEFISVPAIHRPCLKKVRCSWVVFFFSCFGGFYFASKHERSSCIHTLCHHLKLSVCLCKSLGWDSFVPNLSLSVLEGEFLLSFGPRGFADLGGGRWLFSVIPIQNLHTLSLPVLNRWGARCFLPCLSLLNMRLESLAIAAVLWAPSSGGKGKCSSQSLLLLLCFSLLPLAFSLRNSVCQHRCSLWYRKTAWFWSSSDPIQLQLFNTRPLAALLDYSSSFGAFSFRNFNNVNIPGIRLQTVW